MRLRQAARTDANQPEIVKALRKAGGYWIPVGFPFDGLAGLYELWCPVEIKDGAKPPSKRKLTDAEAEFVLDCQARRLPVLVVTSFEELLIGFGRLRG